MNEHFPHGFSCLPSADGRRALSRAQVRTAGIVIALACGSIAHAELVLFDIDPLRSQVQLSGAVSGSAFQEQSAGSLSNAMTGSILVDLTDAQIKFTGGSAVKPPETQSYIPLPGGASGSAPAAYGAKANVKIVVGPVSLNSTANAAARSVNFDLESLDLNRTPTGFDARGITFRIPESANTKLDYRTSGNLTLLGSQAITGLAGNRGVQGKLESIGGVETLTIPFDASYFFEILTPNDTEIKFAGQLVATRRPGTYTPPEIAVARPADPGVPLTLSWPDGYKLQRSTTLSPANWQDSPATSPLQIPLSLPGEYFRIVPR